tara:strand:- start:1684 stop:2325 length:642 start_codon:yes stop_codon:yes gene_type:complete
MNYNYMKKALITGGSSGLGYELIKLLNSEYNFTNISRTKCDIAEENILLDLSNSKKLDKLLEKIDSFYDLIILNAGVLHWKKLGDFSNKEILDDFNINIISQIKILNKLIRKLEKKGATVIIVGSVASFYPIHENGSVYISTKSGVRSLIDTLIKDHPKIRTIGVHPRGFTSSLHKKSGMKRKNRNRPSSENIAKKIFDIVKNSNDNTNIILD